MPAWRMKGEYVKNCNCLQSCPCDTTGNPAPQPRACVKPSGYGVSMTRSFGA